MNGGMCRRGPRPHTHAPFSDWCGLEMSLSVSIMKLSLSGEITCAVSPASQSLRSFVDGVQPCCWGEDTCLAWTTARVFDHGLQLSARSATSRS